MRIQRSRKKALFERWLFYRSKIYDNYKDIFSSSLRYRFTLDTLTPVRLTVSATDKPRSNAYVHDPDYRATVEGMLTQMEHRNKFGSLVTLRNNQPLGWQTDRERPIYTGCKIVIMNAINYYNLLSLLERLRQCSTDDEREELPNTILQSSTTPVGPSLGHHINLGEYDFMDAESQETVFDLEALLNFSLTRPTRSVR